MVNLIKNRMFLCVLGIFCVMASSLMGSRGSSHREGSSGGDSSGSSGMGSSTCADAALVLPCAQGYSFDNNQCTCVPQEDSK